ncbi:MAG: hypothetical protein U0235_10115 [Polyangiaceae bacterium]
MAPISDWWLAPAARATPKSSTRTSPSAPTITFCGDTSRCTTPSGVPSSCLATCAAWRPASTAATIARPIGSGHGPAAASSLKVAPCTYSRTSKKSPSSCTTSSGTTTFG